MFDAQVLPIVRERAGGRALVTRVLKIASMGESDVEQIVAPLYKTFENPRTTILGGAGQTELHLTGEGAVRGGSGRARRGCWRRASTASCPGASTATTAATWRRWWRRCSRSAG